MVTCPVHDRVDVLGVLVSAIDMSDALETIFGWIDSGQQQYVCVTGVHGVMESRRDPGLREVHNRAGLVTPDGMPLVWLCHLRGRTHVRRVYGPDLMLEVCARSVARGCRHFFCGGAETVADRLADRLCERFPGLRVAGTYSPPFRTTSAGWDAETVRRINDSSPDIVWVGLSTPKQEWWMHRHLGRLRAPVMIGVGAAFDFHAGVKRQAPGWMRRYGLEWSFRMMTEPRRLGMRYLRNNPAFLFHVLIQLAGVRRDEAGHNRRSK